MTQQLLLSDELAGGADGADSREHLSLRIIAASPPMPKPERFKRYLMRLPSPQLATRLRILVSQTST
jgi:hypothetical protein